MTDGAVEPIFKEQMQLAIAVGYKLYSLFASFIFTHRFPREKGWEHEDLQKIASGQPPSNTVDDSLMMPILRVMYKAKQWDKVIPPSHFYLLN
jgi:hypothetical protein